MNTKISKYTIGLIGGGNMAASLIGGLVSGNQSANMITAENIIVSDSDYQKIQRLKSKFGINITTDNTELISKSDVVVLAVKPQSMQTMLEPLAETATQYKPLIVSIAAGIQIQSIEKWLNSKQAIVRAMPNTPALVGAGSSGLYANELVSATQKEITETLLNAVGSSVWVKTESDIDSVTALSGSGPAYFMLFIQALSEAAIDAGLNADTAKQLAIDTASGAAELIRQSPDSLDELITKVTSPGGTTEQALKTMHQAKLPDILKQAFEAARLRSIELAKQLDT